MSTVQQEIARDISDKLRLRLTGEESKRLNKGATPSGEAYDLYLKGRYHWNKRTGDDFKQAVQFFTAATEKDPAYALAWSGLSDTYTLMTSYGGVLRPQEAYPKAEAAAIKAVELDDSLAEGHVSLGSVRQNQWDWTGAKKEYRRAIELNPNYATAHDWYSGLLLVLGKKDEALLESKQAIALDPLSLSINTGLGDVYSAMGRFDEAIQQYRKTLEIDPKFVSTHIALGRVYFALHKYPEAFLEWKEAVLDSGDPRVTEEFNGVWKAFQQSGHVAAMKTMADSEIQASAYRYVAPSDIASIYFAAGDKERGFAWLEKAYNERESGLEEIQGDPAIAPYRSDPRYANLLRRMGLPQ